MERYDLVIVLGSQVKRQGNQYILAPHTELKAQAAGVAWQKGITERFLISGGYNFWVRYDGCQIFSNPHFSFKAFALARREKSGAEVIRDYLKENYEIPEEAMFLEELSATTEENAEIFKILLKRPTFAFADRIAILTLLYPMERVFPIFKEAGLKVEQLFAEDLLILEDKSWIDRICDYYSVPKEGKQWDVDKIREPLSNRRSIGELLR
ncbi:MAG: hypothetical protein AOA65_0079 [Candidatus Bathyarchaeota archaeon BA1]|nr:MAG: hypothetical protein AOA65_0079 [Candidatus Bathyarchaeota archaeon BA1]